MKLAPIGNLTPRHQAPDADEKSVAAAHKAAQQFEAIFLRQMMSALEKTSGMGGSSQGGAIYRSMMVGALADNASENGGIGLADMVFKAMMPNAAASPSVPSAAAAGQGAAGAVVPLTAKQGLVSEPLAPAPLAATRGGGG